MAVKGLQDWEALGVLQVLATIRVMRSGRSPPGVKVYSTSSQRLLLIFVLLSITRHKHTIKPRKSISEHIEAQLLYGFGKASDMDSSKLFFVFIAICQTKPKVKFDQDSKLVETFALN